MKLAASAIASVAGIMTGYFAVDAWAQAKVDAAAKSLMQQQALAEAKDSLIHDRLFQIMRVQSAETGIKVAEIELRQIEAQIQEKRSARVQPHPSELRTQQRLLQAIEFHESQLKDARAALESIDTAKRE